MCRLCFGGNVEDAKCWWKGVSSMFAKYYLKMGENKNWNISRCLAGKKTNVLLLHLCVELKLLNLQLLAQTSFVFHSHIYVGDVYSFYQVSSMLLRCLSCKHELCLMVVNKHKSLPCNICSHNLQCIYILRMLWRIEDKQVVRSTSVTCLLLPRCI